MSSKLVFVTGATGFIGAATALAALKAGYHLRISVRKEEQITKLKGIFSDYLDKFDFVVVPDITAPGAFSKVLDNVDFVLHLASPLAGSTEQKYMFNAAKEGTLAILRDAAKVPSVKKVVITSSIAALVPLKGAPEGEVVKGKSFTAPKKGPKLTQDVAAEETGWDLSVDPDANFDAGDPFSTAMQIYSASKLLANQASWDFLEKEKPGFTLVTIHPSLVYGHNLIQQSAKELEGSTNGFFFGSIMNGAQSDTPLLSVYVGDVADAHIRALDSKISSSSSYLVSGKPFTWKDVVDVLQKYYPGVPFKVAPNAEPKLTKTDTLKAEKELGIEWAAPGKIIKEVMDQQLAYFK